MKESTKKQHEIDKANFNKIKADNKARIDSAKKLDPDFKKFKDTKVLKEKTKVVLKHIQRDGQSISEKNRKNYEKMLEENRKQKNNNLNK